MAEPKSGKPKFTWSVKQDKDKPGKYVCDMAEYPGYIQFPHPFMLSHLKKWWEISVDTLKNVEPVEWKHWSVEWEGAKLLIIDYGEWEIEGVSKGDVKEDNIPAVLEEWALACTKDYVLPLLDPKKRLVLLTVL